MEQPLRYSESPTEHCIDDYWTTKCTRWPTSATVHNSNLDTKISSFAGQSTEHATATDPVEEHAPAPETGTLCVPNQDAQIAPDTPKQPTGPATDHKDGLKAHNRGEIELQLATLTEYIRNKKLRPIEWTCCSCAKEQKYRDTLVPLDRLRCQYPRCGVSDKGFRIYRVHDMCDQCTVFVDQRAPVTRKALKKKRDEVREVLKKIKKIYEDVDRLAEFDEEEAEEMANLMKEREAKDQFDREKQEEEDLHRVEMERQQRDEWVDEYEDESETESEGEQGWEEDWKEEEEAEEEKPKRRQQKSQKMRGFKALLGL